MITIKDLMAAFKIIDGALAKATVAAQIKQESHFITQFRKFMSNFTTIAKNELDRVLTAEEGYQLALILLPQQASSIISSKAKDALIKLRTMFGLPLLELLAIKRESLPLNQASFAVFYKVYNQNPNLISTILRTVIFENSILSALILLDHQGYDCSAEWKECGALTEQSTARKAETRGMYAYIANCLDIALLYYNFTLEKEPKNIAVLHNRCDIYNRLQQYQNAYSDLKKIMEYSAEAKLDDSDTIINQFKGDPILLISNVLCVEKDKAKLIAIENELFQLLEIKDIASLADATVAHLSMTFRNHTAKMLSEGKKQFVKKHLGNIHLPKWNYLLGMLLDSMDLEERLKLLPRPAEQTKNRLAASQEVEATSLFRQSSGTLLFTGSHAGISSRSTMTSTDKKRAAQYSVSLSRSDFDSSQGSDAEMIDKDEVTKEKEEKPGDKKLKISSSGVPPLKRGCSS